LAKGRSSRESTTVKDTGVATLTATLLGSDSMTLGATGFSVTSTEIDLVRVLAPEVTRTLMVPFPCVVETMRNETLPSSGRVSMANALTAEAERMANWVLVTVRWAPFRGFPVAESVNASSTAAVSRGST
jgi:hypothetical protein